MTNANPLLDSFAALGDPTRRAIFERVAARPSAVGDLARGLPVSRPAGSQHLRGLKEAGLVSETPEGKRRIYRLDPRRIAPMRTLLGAPWSTATSSASVPMQPGMPNGSAAAGRSISRNLSNTPTPTLESRGKHHVGIHRTQHPGKPVRPRRPHRTGGEGRKLPACAACDGC